MSEARDVFLGDSLFLFVPLEQNDFLTPPPAPEEQYRVRNLDQEREEELQHIVEELAHRNNNSNNNQEDH